MIMVYLTVKTLTMNLKATPTCGIENRGKMGVKDTAKVVPVRKDTTEIVQTNNLFLILKKNGNLLRAFNFVFLYYDL